LLDLDEVASFALIAFDTQIVGASANAVEVVWARHDRKIMQAQTECGEVNRLNFAIEITVPFGARQLEIHAGLRTCQLAFLNPCFHPFKPLVDRGVTVRRRNGIRASRSGSAFPRPAEQVRKDCRLNMSRPSVQDKLKRRLTEHLAIAETYPPEERPLDVRSVAAVLRISPTTLYKYGLNRQINAAEQRQRENGFIAGAAIEQDYFKGEIRKLTEEIEKERERSKGLVGRIAIMEANAARLGFDPEEMHQSILKPVRTMSRAGQGGTGGFRKRSRTIGRQ
jgi:hypothetical protein